MVQPTCHTCSLGTADNQVLLWISSAISKSHPIQLHLGTQTAVLRDSEVGFEILGLEKLVLDSTQDSSNQKCLPLAMPQLGHEQLLNPATKKEMVQAEVKLELMFLLSLARGLDST
jgi:hypothetical protein